MSDVIKQKDGRSYSVDVEGITELRREYLVVMDAIPGADAEAVSWTDIPSIGSAHPTYSNLFVDSYSVKDGTDAEKKIRTVEVLYKRQTTMAETGEAAYAVEEWGWDDGTEDKELNEDVQATPVRNSAGDLFDQVPTVSSPAPTFTKVMKFATRQSSAMGMNCKTNSVAITIGGVTYPIGSLLCTCCEQRLIGDAKWKYKYTVHLKFKSNLVRLENQQTTTDIGWDVAIVDAGMRALNDTSGRLELIKTKNQTTGELETVTSPELLDGTGHVVSRLSVQNPQPYVLRFVAYPTANFPNWFYSEPA